MESVVAPEIIPVRSTAEKTYTRPEVEGALRGSFARYKTAFESGALDSKPELKWKYIGTRDAIAKTVDKHPKSASVYTNKFENHPADPTAHYTQKEGIPIDGLLEFTQQEIERLRAIGEEIPAELEKEFEILNKTSRSYAYSRERLAPERLVARVTQEAQIVAHDPIMQAVIRRELGTNPSQHDIDVANWYKAINVMRVRRELVLPAVTTTTDADDTTDADAADTADETTGDTDTTTATSLAPPQPAPPAGNGETDDGSTNDGGEDQSDEDADRNDITKLRIRGTIIDGTGIASQRAQEEAQKDLDEAKREGHFWEIWRWPKKAWIRMNAPNRVESTRQKLLAQMAIKGTSYIKTDNAYKGIADLSVERAREQADTQHILTRFKSGAITDQENARGEKIVEVKNAQLRQKMIDGILKPIVESIKSGTPLTEEQVQENLRTFVLANLKDHPDELQDFFGPRSNEFGELAQLFATDMIDMAKNTVDAMDRFNKNLEELDPYIQFNIARARGFDTEQRGMVAKWMAEARMKGSYRKAGMIKEAGGRAGILMQPFFVGLGAGLAFQGLMLAGKKEVTAVANVVGIAGALPTGGVSLGISVAAGALAAGLRNNSEGWASLRRHLFERESEDDKAIPDKPTGVLERAADVARIVTGGSSREELEEIRAKLKIESAKHLVEGGGADVASGQDRKSIADLLTSTDAEQIARRIAEIQSRQDFGKKNKVALISYHDVQKQITDIELGRYELQKRLGNLMNSPQAAQDEITRLRSQYDRVFILSKAEAEYAFNRYRLANSLKASAFGGVTGLAGGLLSHELLSGIAKLAPGVSEIPVLGAMFGKHPVTPEELANNGGMPLAEKAPLFDTRINSDVLKQLYEKPAILKLSDSVSLHVDTNHRVSFLDIQGRPLLTVPADLKPDGHIVLSGDGSNLPENIKAIVGSWEQHPNADPAYNLNNHVAEALRSGKPEFINHSNLEIDLNSGEKGHVSIHVLSEPGKPDTGINAHGFTHLDANGRAVFDIDHSYNGNTKMSAEQFKLFNEELQRNGWAVDHTEVAGGNKIEFVQKTVLGPEGQWEKNETTLAHREWYGNNTRPSDLNELRMNTVKNGNAMEIRMDKMNKDGSFSDMLDPRNLDVPQVVREGRAGVAFSFPDQENTRSVIAQINTPRGLSLDPTDNDPNSLIRLWNDKTQAYDLTMQRGAFSQMVLNLKGYQHLPDGYAETELNKLYNVWRVGQDGKFGTVSTGVPKIVDGKTVWQSVATIRGTEGPPPDIGFPEPRPTPPIITDHITPPPAVELVPPPKPETPYIFDPMFIPTPFVPETPLVPLVPPDAPATPDDEPPPFTPYGGPYGTYITSEGDRREHEEAYGVVERFINASPFTIPYEKPAAIGLAKDFLNRTESQNFGMSQSEKLFEEIYGFVATYPTPASLTTDDGSVTTTVRGQIQPAIAALAADATEQEDLIQAIGKFLIANPSYLTGADRNRIELQIKVLVHAYRATKAIFSL